MSEPSKTNANINSVTSTAQEIAGQAIGNKNMQQAGSQGRKEADAEYKAAQAQGYVDGSIDRVAGAKDRIVGAVTGDDSQELAGRARNEKGQAQQELNKPASSHDSVSAPPKFDAVNPSKANAQSNTLLGSIQQTIGDTLGLSGQSASGANRKAAGDAEKADAEAQGMILYSSATLLC